MDFQEYLRAFRTHWVALLIATVLGAVLGYGYAQLQPEVYVAQSTALLTSGRPSTVDDALAADDYASTRANSYVNVAESRQVAEAAQRELGTDASPQSLARRVVVEHPSGTAVLTVTARGGTPESARNLAEAWVVGLSELVASMETAEDGTAVLELQPVESAALPTTPVSPVESRYVMAGAVLGLVLGIAYALVRALMDNRLRTSQDLRRHFDLPVVGILPLDKRAKDALAIAGAEGFSPIDEAVRQLRTNLQFMDVDHPPRIFVVTSALPGDGKTTTALRLAQALAEVETNVVLVDADLRRPSVVKRLGLVPGVGLTDVLVGRASVQDVLQPYGPTGRLHVLGSGMTPPNPSELLASHALQGVLEELAKDSIVLIDTPPLMPVTDAAVLTARTDGALVVAQAGTTTVDVLDKALESIETVHGRVLGLVLNRAQRRGALGSSYEYAYTYESERMEVPLVDPPEAVARGQEREPGTDSAGTPESGDSDADAHGADALENAEADAAAHADAPEPELDERLDDLEADQLELTAKRPPTR